MIRLVRRSFRQRLARVLPPIPELNKLYRGRAIAILTKHGKENLLRELFESKLACRFVRAEGFDTDVLGTFTRDIERRGTQREAARKKAEIAVKVSGAVAGLGSEGAFVTDPQTGLQPWNIEVLTLVDPRYDLEVSGFAEGRACNAHRIVRNLQEAEAFCRAARFPGHHLVVRPDSPFDPRYRSGVASAGELSDAFEWAKANSLSGDVSLENDLRAHCNPSRQEIIKLAALDLIRKFNSRCSKCGAPGFSPGAIIQRVRCRLCGRLAGPAAAYEWQCLRCGVTEGRSAGGASREEAICFECSA